MVGSRKYTESCYEYLNRLLKEYNPTGAPEKCGLQEVNIADLTFVKDQRIEKTKLEFLCSKNFSKAHSEKFPIEVNLYLNGVLEVYDGAHRVAYLIGKSKTIWAKVVPINQMYHTSGSVETIEERVSND